MADRSDPHPWAETWTFFVRHEEPDIWCAVPVTASMPRFLFSGDWRFARQTSAQAERPGGFRPRFAIESESLNGFYLFQRTSDAFDAATGDSPQK